VNSRERVIAAINHQQPDCVPVDLGSTPSSGISAIAYNRLKKYLEYDNIPTRVYDVCQQVAQIDIELVDHFGIDVLDIGRMFNTENSAWYDVILSDGSKAQYPLSFRPVQQADGSWLAYGPDGTCLAKMPVGATFFDQALFPWVNGYPSNFKNLAADIGKVQWAAFAHSPWDHASERDFWDQMRKKAITLRNSTDKALMLVIGCNLFEWGTFLRRLDNFLMDIVLEQEQVERFLDALMELHMDALAKACDALGDVVDIARFGDDLGIDTGPFMSPVIYRKLFKPRHTRLCEYVKKNSNMHTFLHSCGSLYDLIPDLIEAGFEILNPIQTSCKDMDPTTLKREFGKDITFWGGGADTRHVLNNATPSEVKRHVKERLEIFSPGGGFVFNTIHNIMPDVPPENVVAMFEMIKEFNH
jgi:uroporphyrinogen decarboxylase